MIMALSAYLGLFAVLGICFGVWYLNLYNPH